MRKTFGIVLFLVTLNSCQNQADNLIVKNDTSIDIVLFYSEIDDTISNKALYEYSQPTYISNSVEHKNIREELKPNQEVTLIPNLKSIFKNHSNYKLMIFILNLDSLINLKKYSQPDSSMISKVLIGTVTIDKSFNLDKLRKSNFNLKVSEYIVKKISCCYMPSACNAGIIRELSFTNPANDPR
jgi:hypothetical protein